MPRQPLKSMRVAAIDIGSPMKNLGWAIEPTLEACNTGTDLDACIEILATTLRNDAVALGFEAPQFVPFRDKQMELVQARHGEGQRPFSAVAGATVLVTSLVIALYVLHRLRELVPEATAILDWRRPLTERRQLLLWEAFVSDQRKNNVKRKNTKEQHIDDEKLAVADFRRGFNHPASLESSVTAPKCLSLLGAALLRTGWSTDLDLLSEQCLVVRSAPAKNVSV
jgi:hypothetical protein